VVKIQFFVGVVFINGGSVLGQSVDAVVNLLFLPNSGLAVALEIVILKLGDEVLVDESARFIELFNHLELVYELFLF
jgi:hypothetical protein